MPTKIPPQGGISIHALREEGDVIRKYRILEESNFYPRPPRGGRHAGATTHPGAADFYPRPPRGGRPLPTKIHPEVGISIHALREEGDMVASPTTKTILLFLSTPSARRATD